MENYRITEVTNPYKYGGVVNNHREIKFKKETRQAIDQKHLMDGKVIDFSVKKDVNTDHVNSDVTSNNTFTVSSKYTDRVNRLNISIKNNKDFVLNDNGKISNGRRPIKVKPILADNAREMVNTTVAKTNAVEPVIEKEAIKPTEPSLNVESPMIDFPEPIAAETAIDIQPVAEKQAPIIDLPQNNDEPIFSANPLEEPSIDVDIPMDTNRDNMIDIQPERNTRVYGMDNPANLFPKKDIITEPISNGTDYKSSLINSTYRSEIEQLRKDNDNMNDVILKETVDLKQLEDKYNEMLERTTKIEIETLRRELIKKREEAAKLARKKQQMEEMLRNISSNNYNDSSLDRKVA